MAEYEGLKTCDLHFDFTDQSEPDEARRLVTPTPPTGKIEISLTDPLRSSSQNKIYVPETQTIVLTAGAATVRLFLNDDEDIDNLGTAYNVVATVNNKKYQRLIRLLAGVEDTVVEYADLPDAAPTTEFTTPVTEEEFGQLMTQVMEHITNHPTTGGDVSDLATVDYVDSQIQGFLGALGEHVSNEASDPHPNSRYGIMKDGSGRLILTRDTDPLADPLLELLGGELWFPESGV